MVVLKNTSVRFVLTLGQGRNEKIAAELCTPVAQALPVLGFTILAFANTTNAIESTSLQSTSNRVNRPCLALSMSPATGGAPTSPRRSPVIAYWRYTFNFLEYWSNNPLDDENQLWFPV